MVQHHDLDSEDGPQEIGEKPKAERKPRTKKPKQDIGYLVRFDSGDTAHVQKWVDGEVAAEYVYRSKFGTCTCEAAQHGRTCKHAALVAKMRGLKGEPKSQDEAARIIAEVLAGMAKPGSSIESVEVTKKVLDAQLRVTVVFLRVFGRDFQEAMTLKGSREGLLFEVRCVHVD